MTRDYRPSYKTIHPWHARPLQDATVGETCEACGEPDGGAPERHLREECGGARWKKDEMLGRITAASETSKMGGAP